LRQNQTILKDFVQPAGVAGRMVLTLSADGNSFTGQWWYGPAGDGGMLVNL
jgi:hypothetical protein